MEELAAIHQVPSWELRGSLVTGSCGLSIGPIGARVVMKRSYVQFKSESTATEKNAGDKNPAENYLGGVTRSKFPAPQS